MWALVFGGSGAGGGLRVIEMGRRSCARPGARAAPPPGTAQPAPALLLLTSPPRLHPPWSCDCSSPYKQVLQLPPPSPPVCPHSSLTAPPPPTLRKQAFQLAPAADGDALWDGVARLRQCRHPRVAEVHGAAIRVRRRCCGLLVGCVPAGCGAGKARAPILRPSRLDRLLIQPPPRRPSCALPRRLACRAACCWSAASCCRAAAWRTRCARPTAAASCAGPQGAWGGGAGWARDGLPAPQALPPDPQALPIRLVPAGGTRWRPTWRRAWPTCTPSCAWRTAT